MTEKLIAVLVATVVILAAGCGGDDADQTSQPAQSDAPVPAMTKAEFIEQADAICGDMDARVKPIEAKYEQAADAGEYDTAADLLREAVSEAAETQTEVEALEPPAADADTVDQYLEATRDGIGLVRRIADRLEDEDYAALDSLVAEAEQLDARAEGLAQGYGFRECGDGD
jgi:hypothetical protein